MVVPDPESRIGIYHFAILLPTRKDFGLFMKHLITLDIQFGQADHLVSEAIYLKHFQKPIFQLVLRRNKINLLVYEPEQEVIIQWITH